MGWQPLLEGAVTDRARESVEAILGDLGHLAPGQAGDTSLAGGSAGLAVLHGYLAQAGRGRHHASAVRTLQRATAAVADTPTEYCPSAGKSPLGKA